MVDRRLLVAQRDVKEALRIFPDNVAFRRKLHERLSAKEIERVLMLGTAREQGKLRAFAFAVERMTRAFHEIKAGVEACAESVQRPWEK